MAADLSRSRTAPHLGDATLFPHLLHTVSNSLAAAATCNVKNQYGQHQGEEKGTQFDFSGALFPLAAHGGFLGVKCLRSPLP